MAMQAGLADDSILDKYSEVRIKKWKEMIDPMSRANFRRIWAEDAIPERDEFFAMCRKMENDEEMQKQSAGVSRHFHKGNYSNGSQFTHLLNEDFSAFFKKQQNGVAVA